MKVTINNVRLAFPHLFEAQMGDNGKAKFSAAFIFGKDSEAKKVLDKAIEETGAAKFGAKWAAMKKQMAAGDNLLIHNGDAKASLAGYEGNLYINAYSVVRPTVVDRSAAPITEAEGKIYSGCYVNAIIELWGQANEYGKKINAQLMGVQFCKDGDPFISGGKAAEIGDFSVITDDSDLL